MTRRPLPPAFSNAAYHSLTYRRACALVFGIITARRPVSAPDRHDDGESPPDELAGLGDSPVTADLDAIRRMRRCAVVQHDEREGAVASRAKKGCRQAHLFVAEQSFDPNGNLDNLFAQSGKNLLVGFRGHGRNKSKQKKTENSNVLFRFSRAAGEALLAAPQRIPPHA